MQEGNTHKHTPGHEVEGGNENEWQKRMKMRVLALALE